MTNKQFQDILKQYPDEIKIKLLHNSSVPIRDYKSEPIRQMTEENILHTSEGAYVNDDAPVSEWDCEDGKICHKGDWYILLNPIIN